MISLTTPSDQRISNKHLVGTVAVNAFLVLTKFRPPVTKNFANCSVVEVWVLTTDDASLLLTKQHKGVHRTTNVDATFGLQRLKQQIFNKYIQIFHKYTDDSQLQC